MMPKKISLLIPALAVIFLLTVGATAIVLAQDGSPPPKANGGGHMAKVAAILDIPQDDLVGAFKQAKQEMQQEAFDRALDGAVGKGIITESEAAEIREWQEQKPEAFDRFKKGKGPK